MKGFFQVMISVMLQYFRWSDSVPRNKFDLEDVIDMVDQCTTLQVSSSHVINEEDNRAGFAFDAWQPFFRKSSWIKNEMLKHHRSHCLHVKTNIKNMESAEYVQDMGFVNDLGLMIFERERYRDDGSRYWSSTCSCISNPFQESSAFVSSIPPERLNSRTLSAICSACLKGNKVNDLGGIEVHAAYRSNPPYELYNPRDPSNPFGAVPEARRHEFYASNYYKSTRNGLRHH